jgi:hypothetical protein
MTGKTYLYRRGDGNEGNFPRFLVTLGEGDNPFAAMAALVANDYIAGKRVRRHIIRTLEVDGEADYGIHALCYDGPDGERAFDAAWLTAELQPLSDKDLEYYRDTTMPEYTLRQVLDRPAMRQYRAKAKGTAQ